MYKNYRVFYILILFSFLNAEALTRREINSIYSKIDSLIYKDKDYDKALRLSKELISVPDIGRYYVDNAENIINLIENYSDYDRKPLELFFKYRINSKERSKENENIFREILEKYPDCKLAGFTQYLLAKHYESLIGSGGSYLENPEVAGEKAIESYGEVVRKYPAAEMPITDLWHRSKIGTKIAPLAQLRIGDLYNSDYHYCVYPMQEEAIKAYKLVINNYPEDVDRYGNKVAVDAYVSILNMYREDIFGKTILDTLKAREICNILINKFPNQGYLVEGLYFGEIHPEAYMVLADCEVDKEKALEIYEKIVAEFPNSWRGQVNSGAVSLYSISALGRIGYLFKDPQAKINCYRKFLDSSFDRKVRGRAQFEIAFTYEMKVKDYNQALIEYQKVLENFSDVSTGGEAYTLGEDAKDSIRRIQEKLNEEQKTDVKSP